jgi:hypothetical protein
VGVGAGAGATGGAWVGGGAARFDATSGGAGAWTIFAVTDEDVV